VGFSHLISYPTAAIIVLWKNKIIKNDNFRKIASNIKPDVKKRVVICKEAISEGVTYHVYSNDIGQIILDPQISIPAAEIWLYKDAKGTSSGSSWT